RGPGAGQRHTRDRVAVDQADPGADGTGGESGGSQVGYLAIGLALVTGGDGEGPLADCERPGGAGDGVVAQARAGGVACGDGIAANGRRGCRPRAGEG